MATFPSVTQSYGASKISAPRIRSTQFNDGYSQRIKFGINIDPKKWRLSWSNISETDSDTIETFLEARGKDGASFDWSPPDETTTYKWICRGFGREMFDSDRSRITASFEQVFEP